MKKYLKFIPYFLLGAIAALFIFKPKLNPQDILNYSGIAVGVLSLAIAWYQTHFAVSTAEESKIDSLEKEVKSEIAEIRRNSDKRDIQHDNEIARMREQLAIAVTNYNFLQQELYKINDNTNKVLTEMNGLRIEIAASTEKGKMLRKIQMMEKRQNREKFSALQMLKSVMLEINIIKGKLNTNNEGDTLNL